MRKLMLLALVAFSCTNKSFIYPGKVHDPQKSNSAFYSKSAKTSLRKTGCFIWMPDDYSLTLVTDSAFRISPRSLPVTCDLLEATVKLTKIRNKPYPVAGCTKNNIQQFPDQIAGKNVTMTKYDKLMTSFIEGIFNVGPYECKIVCGARAADNNTESQSLDQLYAIVKSINYTAGKQ